MEMQCIILAIILLYAGYILYWLLLHDLERYWIKFFLYILHACKTYDLTGSLYGVGT